MRIVNVIPSRTWVNAINGSRASIYGALPYVRPSEANEWAIIDDGWTWGMDNNTVGCCRAPAKTEAEARAFMAEWNGRLDATALESLPGMIEVNRERVAEATAFAATGCGDYPAAKRSAKRNLEEAKARLAECERRYASLIAA